MADFVAVRWRLRAHKSLLLLQQGMIVFQSRICLGVSLSLVVRFNLPSVVTPRGYRCANTLMTEAAILCQVSDLNTTCALMLVGKATLLWCCKSWKSKRGTIQSVIGLSRRGARCSAPHLRPLAPHPPLHMSHTCTRPMHDRGSRFLLMTRPVSASFPNMRIPACDG